MISTSSYNTESASAPRRRVIGFPNVVAVVGFLLLASASCTNRQADGLDSIPSSTAEAASTQADTLLNSERIRLKYGSYAVEVLYSDSTTRVSSLFSTADLSDNASDSIVNITRTFAVVMYPPRIDDALREAHALILGGQSIGEVFKAQGHTIVKKTIFIGTIKTSTAHDTIFRLMGIAPTYLAIYIYTFQVEMEDPSSKTSYQYATIAEVYHPDYLTIEDLQRLYPPSTDQLSVTDYQLSADSIVTAAVGRVGDR